MDKDKKQKYKDLMNKADYQNYINGSLESRQYSSSQLAEKRKYFESMCPPPNLNISKQRWLYEIKRHFELSDDFKKYPDAGLARLEFLLKYGY